MAGDVVLKISAEFKEALDNVDKFTKEVSGSINDIEKQFSFLGTTLAAVTGLFVADKLVHGLEAIFEAGLEAEKSTKKLTGALLLTGEATQENIDLFNEFADTLSRQTAIDDDVIKGQIAFLKSLGATNDQVKAVITAATDLSAVLGQSLSTSVEQLAKTYQGQAGILGRLIPGVNNLTREQLTQGDAVKLLQQNYDGLAASQVKGVSGAIALTNIAFQNLKKSIGAALLDSEVLKGVFQTVATTMQSLAEAVSKVKFEDIQKGAVAIASLVASVVLLPRLVAGFQLLSAAITLVSTNFSILQARTGAGVFEAIAVAAKSAAAGIDLARISVSLFKGAATLGLTIVIDQLAQFVIEAGGIGAAFDKVSTSVALAFANIEASVLGGIASVLEAVSSIPGGIGEEFKGLAEGARASANTAANSLNVLQLGLRGVASDAKKASDAVNETSSSARGLGRDLTEIRSQIESQIKTLKDVVLKASSTQQENIAREFAQRVDLISKAQRLNIIGIKEATDLRRQSEIALIKDLKKAQEDADKDRLEKLKNRIQVAASNPFNLAFQNFKAPDISNETADLAGGIAGGLQTALKGAGGAADLFSGLAGGFANAIIPGLGVAIQPIISELAKGPDSVRATITAFTSNIPTIIENVIASIPVLIEALAEQMPVVIDRLIEELPRVIQSFIDHIPEIVIKLIEGFVRAAVELQFRMPLVATQLAISLTAEMPKVAVSFVDQLVKEAPRFVTELVKSIPSAIGGAVGGIGGVLGIGGGGGGIIGGIGDIFGFADGGVVQGGAPFTDRVPAALTPGETVVDRNLTQKLEQFLNGSVGSGGGQNMTVNLVVGEENLASVILNLNRKGFRLA